MQCMPNACQASGASLKVEVFGTMSKPSVYLKSHEPQTPHPKSTKPEPASPDLSGARRATEDSTLCRRKELLKSRQASHDEPLPRRLDGKVPGLVFLRVKFRLATKPEMLDSQLKSKL